MERPFVRPLPIIIMNMLVDAAAPMAARASMLTKRPTTMVSTRLYISWNTPPIHMGMAKSTKSFMGLPSVMSRPARFSVSISYSSLVFYALCSCSLLYCKV